MKKTFHIKEALLLMTFASAILLIASCNDSQNTNTRDSRTVSEDQNKSRFDDKKQEKDAQFLVNAAEMNLELIQLGQLAQQKGKTREVKELGRTVEAAHTKLQTELTALASSKRVSIPSSPTSDTRDAYSKLNQKTGDDFDQEYVNMMVRKHKSAINDFEKASEDGNDSDIRNWARNSLPHLRTHLDRSTESQKRFADMYFEERR